MTAENKNYYLFNHPIKIADNRNLISNRSHQRGDRRALQIVILKTERNISKNGGKKKSSRHDSPSNRTQPAFALHVNISILPHTHVPVPVHNTRPSIDISNTPWTSHLILCHQTRSINLSKESRLLEKPFENWTFRLMNLKSPVQKSHIQSVFEVQAIWSATNQHTWIFETYTTYKMYWTKEGSGINIKCHSHPLFRIRIHLNLNRS